MNIPFRFYWSLLMRRLPVMMALFLVCSGLGVVAAFKLPPTFDATARLQVEAPQIPEEMVVSMVQTGAAEQLEILEVQTMTRANLIDIAQKHQVFEDMDRMTPDRIVEAMRQNTRIQRSGGRGEATLMSISFSASNGQVAANVVNDYVTLMLDASSSFRRARAENTLSFFQQEAERLAEEIDEQSNRIIEFKRQNVDALPEDLEYRQNRQATLQERLSRLEQDRASIANQRSEMISVFEATGRLSPTSRTELTPEQQRLQELELQLSEALTVYSESHPRIAQLRSQIDQMERRIAGAGSSDADSEEGQGEASFLDITLAEMDQRIKETEREIVRVTAELERLDQEIAATATNSITLERMDRDLESTRGRYNTVLANLNQARMADRIEVRAQGQRISLIEGPVVPQEPSGPPRTMIAAAGVGGGMGLAVGFFVLLELLNRKIRRPAELKSRFMITPIGVIPYMESRMERLKRRGLLLTAILAVAIAVPYGLYYIHTEYLPLELLANRILIRLGLT